MQLHIIYFAILLHMAGTYVELLFVQSHCVKLNNQATVPFSIHGKE